MHDWPMMTLREAGVTLIDCVHKTPVAVADGHPYVTIPLMRDGRIDFTGARRISRDDFKEWTKKARPQRHDVVLSRRTNPGVTATFGDQCDFALGQNLVLLRADGRKVLPEFLRWLVIGPAWWGQIEKYNNVGAVFDSLKCADVPRFELPIPPKDHQRAIASVLGALDDKIDLNGRMSETLEAMARAFFKDWFVDFGPTRAMMDGRSPYLEADVWSLFPERLDENERPVGWGVSTLARYADLNPESWSRSTYPSTVRYVDLSGTKWGRIHTVETHSRSAAPSRAQRVLRPGDTIVGTVRPGNGSFAMVGDDGLTGSTGFAVLRPKQLICREFVYLAVTSPESVDRLSHLADGAAYPAVRPEAVLGTEVATGPDTLLRAFSEVAAPILDRLSQNTMQNVTLAATRDLLLPKLMSGELRVRDAEKAAEAVL